MRPGRAGPGQSGLFININVTSTRSIVRITYIYICIIHNTLSAVTVASVYVWLGMQKGCKRYYCTNAQFVVCACVSSRRRPMDTGAKWHPVSVVYRPYNTEFAIAPVIIVRVWVSVRCTVWARETRKKEGRKKKKMQSFFFSLSLLVLCCIVECVHCEKPEKKGSHVRGCTGGSISVLRVVYTSGRVASHHTYAQADACATTNWLLFQFHCLSACAYLFPFFLLFI